MEGKTDTPLGRLATLPVIWVVRWVFFTTFSVVTLPAWLYALVTDTCGCKPTTAEGLRIRGRFFARVISTLWSIAFKLCFWLDVDARGLAPLDGAGQGERQVFVAANHTSYIDTPLICALTPRHLVGDMKTLFARAHLKLPVLGRLANAVGHMPVPYTSRESFKFTIDKELMQKLSARVDEHVAAGGHLIVFPEGDLNRQWHTLKQFRAGCMEICIRHDMEIWGWLMVGSAVTWPANLVLGGGPAKLTNRGFLIHASAKEAAAKLAGSDASLQEQARALATDVQAAMQRTLDDMIQSYRLHTDLSPYLGEKYNQIVASSSIGGDDKQQLLAARAKLDQ